MEVQQQQGELFAEVALARKQDSGEENNKSYHMHASQVHPVLYLYGRKPAVKCSVHININ